MTMSTNYQRKLDFINKIDLFVRVHSLRLMNIIEPKRLNQADTTS